SGFLEHIELAGNADLIDARVGAQVGQKNQARIQAGGYTVGHGRRVGYGWRIVGPDGPGGLNLAPFAAPIAVPSARVPIRSWILRSRRAARRARARPNRNRAPPPGGSGSRTRTGGS